MYFKRFKGNLHETVVKRANLVKINDFSRKIMKIKQLIKFYIKKG